MAIVAGYQPVQQIINPQGLFTLPINEMYKALENRQNLYDSAENTNTAALGEFGKIMSAVLPQSRPVVQQQIDAYKAKEETLRSKYGNDLSNPLYLRSLKDLITTEAGNPVYSDALYSAQQNQLYNQAYIDHTTKFGAPEDWQNPYGTALGNWSGEGRLDFKGIEPVLDFPQTLLEKAKEVLPYEFQNLEWDDEMQVYKNVAGKTVTREQLMNFLQGLEMDKNSPSGQQFVRRYGVDKLDALYGQVADALTKHDAFESFAFDPYKTTTGSGNTNTNTSSDTKTDTPNYNVPISSPLTVAEKAAGYENVNPKILTQNTKEVVEKASAELETNFKSTFDAIYPGYSINYNNYDPNTNEYALTFKDGEGATVDWKHDPKLAPYYQNLFVAEQSIKQAKHLEDFYYETMDEATKHAREISGLKEWVPVFPEYAELNPSNPISETVLNLLPKDGYTGGVDTSKMTEQERKAYSAYKDYFTQMQTNYNPNTGKIDSDYARTRATNRTSMVINSAEMEKYWDDFSDHLKAGMDREGGITPFVNPQTGVGLKADEIKDIIDSVNTKVEGQREFFTAEYYLDGDGFGILINANGHSMAIPPEHAYGLLNSYFSTRGSSDLAEYNLVYGLIQSMKGEKDEIVSGKKPFGYIGDDSQLVRVLTHDTAIDGVGTKKAGTYVYKDYQGKTNYFDSEIEVARHYMESKSIQSIADFLQSTEAINKIDQIEGFSAGPNNKGAIGEMQITQPTIDTLNNVLGKNYFFTSDGRLVTPQDQNTDQSKAAAKEILLYVYPQALAKQGIPPETIMVLMSYNAGPGRRGGNAGVASWVTGFDKQGRSIINLNSMPYETKEYIMLFYQQELLNTNFTREQFRQLPLAKQNEYTARILNANGVASTTK